MAELSKVRRVIAKQIPDAPHETLLTVDATTGQNGLRQARLFSEAVGVNGLVLTKLDGTAKGGIALAIAYELGIPVKLIGVGEQLEDLRPFDPLDFARALVTAGVARPDAGLWKLPSERRGLRGILKQSERGPKARMRLLARIAITGTRRSCLLRSVARR